MFLLGQVEEKGNRRAEPKAEDGARIRGGVWTWERSEMCKSVLSKRE